MGILSIFGQSGGFASKVKAAIERVQKSADKDPDTFKDNVAELETELGGRKDAVEKSVAHAMLGSAYKQMTWTHITDYDEETREKYRAKQDEHFGHVLDDMEALANAKSSTYKSLIVGGRDGDLYGNDMLSVMILFLEQNASLTYQQRAVIYEKAFGIYRKRGNLNGYGLMKQKWLDVRREVEKGEGGMDAKEYKEACYQLLQEVKGEEIGADLALAYSEEFLLRDESILFLKWAVDSVGNGKRKSDLRHVLEQKLQPTVRMYGAGKVLANRPSSMELSFWNCERATLTVRKYVGRKMGEHGPKELLLTGDVVEKREVVLAIDEKNDERKKKGLPVEGSAKASLTLPAGRYVYVAEGIGERSVTEVWVTTLRVLEQNIGHQKSRLIVVDNETGRPVPGVKVQFRKELPDYKDRSFGWESRGVDSELVTGADGMVEVNKPIYIRAVRTEDDCTEWTRHYNSWRVPAPYAANLSFRVMTDRSIYRPGQTLKAAVMAYWQEGDEVGVRAGELLTVTLTDAKHKKIATQNLETNAYGTASFEVSLPADCEVGMMHIRVEGGGSYANETVRVEEYKRPTFDVTFDGNRAGHFGETLEAEGTAMMFAGVPVQGAQVHYTVEYASMGFKHWWWNVTWKPLSEGDLTTDDEGKFRVPVLLTDEHLTSSNDVMRYRVKAVVTDVGGETHEASCILNASNREFGLSLKVDDVLDLAQGATFKVEAYDVNYEKVTVSGKYQVLYGSKVMQEGQFTTDEPVQLSSTLKMGVRYYLKVVAIDKKGKEIYDTESFRLINSSLPAISVKAMNTEAKCRAESMEPEEDFIYAPKKTFAKGGYVDLYFTTAETDAYIIYNVYGVEGLIDHQVGVTDGTMKHLRLQYKDAWEEGIQVEILYVRNGHYAVLSQTFELERPEKRLKLEWATFRDKLQPGQQEQWTLTVTDKKGRKVNDAELMAVLYDASLDRLYGHDWNFWLGFGRRKPSVRTGCSDSNSFPTFSLSGHLTWRDSYDRKYPELIGFEHNRFINRRGGWLEKGVNFAMAGRAMMVEDGAVPMAMAVAEEAVDETSEHAEMAPVPEENFDQATVRENFAETAFFLPQLVTDKQGKVNIQFTLPESLTEWKFMGFAHTKEVDYGDLTATAVARKEFMLRPNMPRFVRWGDEVVLASSVINQSEKPLSGAVRMRLIDPVTKQVVLGQEKAFDVEAGKTVGVDFSFDVKEEWNDLDCEIIAMSGNVSDGEKNPLPVLTTKKEMVESVPYYLIGNAEGGEVGKTMDLSQLYNQNSVTATHRTLKVEYTDNPVWMCVEALRSVKNPEEDDAIDFAASLYANTRLAELMQTFPVMEKHEDLNALKQQTEKAESKLSELQNADGGWSWFKGMNSSFYTTLAVCEHLAKFPKPNERVKQMLEKGMRYLDNQKLSSFNYMKKKRKIWPSDSDLRYLFVSAQMPERPVSKEIQEMREVYLSRVEKAHRDLTIYGVANTAYTLRAFNHVKSADELVDFLKEYTVERPGQGRFYATDAAYYSWMDYRIPTQVAAMKAIWQKDKKDAILNDMQLWLISQKQVQKWDNPMNTIDVVDFLLKVSPVQNFHEVKRPVFVVDGTELQEMDYGTINTERDQMEGREANLILEGNMLADVPEKMLVGGVKQLEVKKQTQGISWGAAYATFLEDVGNLKLYATTELKIQRKFYVQHAGSDKWTDYEPTQVLTVGDKLRIRHIITADRDMDFVRVSAQHPACLEPLRHLSGYQWMGGRGCYLSIHDARFDMFFDWFTRGTSTVDMDYSIVRAGTYQVGVSTVECVYAKQFGGHTEGMRLQVKSKK